MEDLQISAIKHNLPFLLDNTECTTPLLIRLSEFLIDYDIQSIKSKETKQDKNYRLYDLMAKRVGGFDKLAEVLLETKQTKSGEVLLRCLILAAISNCTVEIPGKTGKFTDFRTKDQLQVCVAALLKTAQTMDLYKDYKNFISNGTKVRLKDTVPPPPEYYIPRNLFARRAVLDPGVFRVPCQDVFVFKTSHPAQLLFMLNNQPVSSSVKQLVKVTARFILLKEEVHWKIILKKSKFPANLVSYEFVDGKHSCVLEDTTAGTSVIHKYLEHQPNDVDATIPEQEFIETALQTKGSGICICDKPGMGKSFLLANLARSTQSSFSERLVIFIQLSQISGKISGNPEGIDEHLFADIILGTLHENALTRFMLAQLIKFGETPMALFFDGFDEIQQEHIQSIKLFLSNLREIRNIRLYVTSRINTRTDLEESLGVMAYDVQPFTESNQQEFLTTYWKTKYPENDLDRIEEYASLCLQELGKNLNDRDREIAGVPLICRMMANVYSDNADIYSQPERRSTVKMEMLDTSTLSQIYAKYMNRQLGAALCNFKCLFKRRFSVMDWFLGRRRIRCNEKCMQKSYHAWIAVQIVFPELGARLEKFIVKINADPSLLSAGLLEKRFGSSALSEDLQFSHRTFAEYLATEFISQFWVKSPSNSYPNEVRNILADFTLLKMLGATKLVFYGQGVIFKNGVCAYFYEDLLKSRPESFIKDANELSSPASIYSEDVQSILFACIWMNYEKTFSLVFTLITERLLSNPCESSMHFCSAMQLKAAQYSGIAVRRGNVRIVDPLLSFLHNTLKVNCKNSDHDSSLEIAVESEDIELVQCVSKFRLFYDADLLRACLKEDDAACLYLDDLRLSLCEVYVSQSINTGSKRGSSCHLNLIKDILNLEMGRSLYYKYEMRYYVLDKLSACEYLELEKFVWDTRKVDISFKTNHKMPLGAAKLYIKSKEFRSKLEEILSLYDKPLPVHLLLTNAFHRSVGRLQVESLKLLVECGATYWDNSGIEKDRTALHLAANEYVNVETVEYLICLGLSTNSQDEDGNTPLHLATRKLEVEVMKVLIKRGCDMHLRNGRGRTFIQEAATWETDICFDSDEEFFELVVFLRDFVGRDRFREKDGIFMEGLVARYGAALREKVKQLLL